LFDLLNGKIENGQNTCFFPISNWTELDVWVSNKSRFINTFYKRKVFLRDGMIWSHLCISRRRKRRRNWRTYCSF
jgi:sulfate adenylyltransferase subunit 2